MGESDPGSGERGRGVRVQVPVRGDRGRRRLCADAAPTAGRPIRRLRISAHDGVRLRRRDVGCDPLALLASAQPSTMGGARYRPCLCCQLGIDPLWDQFSPCSLSGSTLTRCAATACASLAGSCSTSSCRSWSSAAATSASPTRPARARTLRRRRDEWIAAGVHHRLHQPALAPLTAPSAWSLTSSPSTGASPRRRAAAKSPEAAQSTAASRAASGLLRWRGMASRWGDSRARQPTRRWPARGHPERPSPQCPSNRRRTLTPATTISCAVRSWPAPIQVGRRWTVERSHAG
jgi:hypothetical protein